MFKYHYQMARWPLSGDILLLTTKPPGIPGGTRPQKYERLSRSWSHLAVLTSGALDLAP